jgi:hypothetical protein
MEDKLQEDLLDARLRDESPYIDDAGFTSRVVQKLPTRQVRHFYRALILIGITLAACLAAYRLVGGTGFLIEGITDVAMMPVMLMWLCAGAAAALVMAGGLAAAYSRSRGRSR